MSECTCGKPTRDAAYVCDDCGDQLARALGDIPALTEELTISITRQRGIDYRTVGGGKHAKPAEMPSPVTWSAAEARTHLRALLVSWVLFCEAERVRTSDPGNDMPDDDMAAMSRWLLWRVDGLTLNEIGPDAVEEITSAVAHCHRLIDRPADRQYLGRCEACESGRLFAKAGSAWAVCEECQDAVDAVAVRSRLVTELEDRLCTAAEIAHLSTYLGLRADREQVRKRINQWATRKQIVEHAGVTDEALFQFGEVYKRLVQTEYGPVRHAG